MCKFRKYCFSGKKRNQQTKNPNYGQTFTSANRFGWGKFKPRFVASNIFSIWLCSPASVNQAV